VRLRNSVSGRVASTRKRLGFSGLGAQSGANFARRQSPDSPPAADCTPAAKLMIKKKAGCPSFRGFRNVVRHEIGPPSCARLGRVRAPVPTVGGGVKKKKPRSK